ncbi:lantibiotic, gallidermin/nisin family [Parageobacillus thermantarcticus]|uniref:Lantibiotic n=1 Tax=Parageobacillus thermantarcticus TaxID=186116 RepID=A0A1I0TQ92_9BACL|nr:lantibiotic, gallidermin/nisin family [Parageobacillus thermantarcticus]
MSRYYVFCWGQQLFETVPYYNHNKLKKIIKNIYQYINEGMAKLDDFDLDIVVKKQDNVVQPNVTSKPVVLVER